MTCRFIQNASSIPLLITLFINAMSFVQTKNYMSVVVEYREKPIHLRLTWRGREEKQTPERLLSFNNNRILESSTKTMSSSQNVFKSLKNAFPPNQDIAWKISTALISGAADHRSLLSSDLEPGAINLVLSNPRLPPRACLSFFNFLRTTNSHKPDLQTHLTLARRLYEVRQFAHMKRVLNFIATDEDVRRPVPDILDLIEKRKEDEENYYSKFVGKFCDMMFRVYAENGMFEKGFRVFDYADRIGISIEERSCHSLLVGLKRAQKMDLCLEFFDLMVKKGIEITVYSLTIVVDGLCKNGEIEKAKDLVNEMRSKVKANVFTYNTLVLGYIERKDFEGVNEVLRLMEKDQVCLNNVTYTLLIEWYGSCGEIEEVEKMFDEMRERKIEPDLYVYTSLIKWSCRLGNLKRAFSLFDELTARGLVANAHTYGALVNGLCKAGQMAAAEILVSEMRGKGIEVNLIVYNTLMDGYCRKGMIDEAMKLKVKMEKRGLEIDIFSYNSIASGLCKLKRYEEAKRLLFAMVESGVSPNVVSYTTLVDIYCKEGNIDEAKRLFKEMEKKGKKPNIVTYNALVDGYSKKGKMKEALKLKREMEANGMMPDLYTFTSLIHGECIAGKLDEALKLFNEMSLRGLTQNAITYTAMISGLSKEGRTDEAFRLYDEMINVGLTPDDRVYTSLVSSLHPAKS